MANLCTLQTVVIYGLPSGAANSMSAFRACSVAGSPGLRLRGPKPGSGNPSIPRGGRNPGMPGGCVTADMAAPLKKGWLPKDGPGANMEGGPIWGWVWLWGSEYGCGWTWGGGYPPIRCATGGRAANRARSKGSRGLSLSSKMVRLSTKVGMMPCEWPKGPLCLSLDNITSSWSSAVRLSPGSLGISSLRPPEIRLGTEVDGLRSKELRISCEDDDVSGFGSVLVKLAILKPVEWVGLMGDLRPSRSIGLSLSRRFSLSSSDIWTVLRSRSGGLLVRRLTLWGESTLPRSLSRSWSRSLLLSLSISRSKSRSRSLSRSLPRSCSRSFSRSDSRLNQLDPRPQSRFKPCAPP